MLIVAVCVIAALLVIGGSAALILGGCGAKTVRVYSSLPLHGAQGKQVEDMVNAIKLALEQADNKAGKFKVEYEPRDDSTEKAGEYTDGQVAKNAGDAARDAQVVGYIGDFDSGATAVSIPTLSEAKVAQISPASTAVGLTSSGASADPGEPDTHYSGTRNFARIVPKDSVQADALAIVMSADGCGRVAMIFDAGVYGRRLAREMRRALKARGLKLPFDKTPGSRERRLPAIAREKGADCFFYSGSTSEQAVRLFTQMAFALPEAKLYGPDGLNEQAFTNGRRGGIPADVAARTKLTAATLGRDSYGAAGKKFFADYEQEYGEANPEVYAIFAYEAMLLMLDAIERSESGDREDVVKALLATVDRDSALGRYSIDHNGDTTLRDYGLFDVQDGRPTFLEKIVVPKTR